jgi:hypothetical protein
MRVVTQPHGFTGERKKSLSLSSERAAPPIPFKAATAVAERLRSSSSSSSSHVKKGPPPLRTTTTTTTTTTHATTIATAAAAAVVKKGPPPVRRVGGGPPPLVKKKPKADEVISLFKYAAQRPCELTLAAGVSISGSDTHKSGRWTGTKADGTSGVFPSNYVKEHV